MDEASRRARKKEQTRQLIADAAQRLFAERGFDQVTVAEIATTADVAEKTVYNHFPTKEDLVFDQTDSFESALLAAIGGRAAGESPLDAYGTFLRERFRRVATREAAQGLASNARIIMGSTALQAREELVFARLRDSLAGLLAAETQTGQTDVEPFVAAGAMVSMHRVVLRTVRDHVLSGGTGDGLTRVIAAHCTRAISLLTAGLAEYGRRQRA
jgi:AcrR family transcriptional regulator